MSHYYKMGNYSFPSVTTIISDVSDKSGALTQWSANQVVEWIKQNAYHATDPIDQYLIKTEQLDKARFHFREVSQEACDIGSTTHAAIEHFLKTGRKPQIENKQAETAYQAFLEWFNDNECKTIFTEKIVQGTNGWAGTLDWIGYLNGKGYVLDWKTSKAIYSDARYQIAAYRHAVEHTLLPSPFKPGLKPEWLSKIDGCGIVRIDKETGLPEFKDTSKTYKKDLEVFKAMVKLFFLKHPRIAKKAGVKT